jgi:hypothetical protein
MEITLIIQLLKINMKMLVVDFKTVLSLLILLKTQTYDLKDSNLAGLECNVLF